MLPKSDPTAPLLHCLQVISQICLVKPDLTDVHLLEMDDMLFMDGSSYLKDGVKYARAAVVSQTGETKWASSASSAQRAELIGLAQALQIVKDKTVNIYTDRRYALLPSNPQGELQKQRPPHVTGGSFKNKEEMLAFL